MNSLDNTYWWGQIRRGKDGKLYIPSQYSTATEIGTWDPTTQQASTETFFADANVTFGGALPTQVVKSYRQSDLQEQPEFYRCIGEKQFELKDHLGNVRVLINDEKRYTDESGDGAYGSGDYLVPTVLGFYDYYPFGMQQPGRSYTNGSQYRYGFNGMEKDDEISGNGNSYTTEFRQYDVRLGRWFSVDPLMAKYSAQSPYGAFNNNPVF